MPSSTVEDYLKQLYLLEQKIGFKLVPMGRLSTKMMVAPGTATAMIKTLANSLLVDYEPRNGVRLTHSGKQLALHVLRRHRLVEAFLVEILELDWSQVHQEAEQLEHAISDTVLERIDKLLGEPSVDPHGDPIPTAKGLVNHARLVCLIDCPVGQSAIIARITDQNPRFLQFADDQGLTPGTQVSVDRYDEPADAVTVHCEGKQSPVTIGASAAAKIFVETT